MERRRFLKTLGFSTFGCVVAPSISSLFPTRSKPITFTAEANDPEILKIAADAFEKELGGEWVFAGDVQRRFHTETPVHVLKAEMVRKKG